MNTVREAVLQVQGRGGVRQAPRHEVCAVTSGALMDGSALVLTRRIDERAAVVVIDVDPEHEDEFNRWYDEEHIPEKRATPGLPVGAPLREP